MTEFPGNPRFTDDDLRVILGRALELDDAWRNTISRDELRSIARELGVSEAAVAKALEERVSPHTPAAPGDEFSPFLHTVLLGGAAGAAGPLFSEVVGPSESLVGLMAVQNIAVLIAAKTNGRFRHARFQLRNLGLWTGYVAGSAVFHPFLAGAFIGLGAEFGSITAVAGGALLLIRDVLQRTKHVDARPPRSEISVVSVTSMFQRCRQRISWWLHQRSMIWSRLEIPS